MKAESRYHSGTQQYTVKIGKHDLAIEKEMQFRQKSKPNCKVKLPNVSGQEEQANPRIKTKKTIIIANLIDWSESFVDKNGSFYCGTTDEQKFNATKVLSLSDIVINAMDLHPITAPEHAINGGLYPVHNAIKPEQFGKDFIYLTKEGKNYTLDDRTLSPRLTRIISDSLIGRNAGIIVPREVYFQGETTEPFCTPAEIEETFGQNIITAMDFLAGEYTYITAPKQDFDATRTTSNYLLPKKDLARIPSENFNVYHLIKERYPDSKYSLIFVNTGVVEGICRLHTSIGLRELFKKARIINISDATTPLFGMGLGYESAQESRDASMKVCKDVGIEYITTEECLKTFGK